VSDEDEDWFESALQDEDQQSPSESADESEDRAVEERPPPEDAGDEEDPAFDQVDDASDTSPTGRADDEDEELFQDDFAAAFDGAAGPGSGPGGGGFDAGGSPGAGDGPGGGFDPSGFGGEPFASEFDDDAEFDSEIPRIDVGIEGLDSMILGGVPERSLMVSIGDAGTGKTTFGLQFLNEGLENDENVVFITLEESRERVLNTAAEKGWDFEGYADDDQLAILDLDPIEMANTLQSIRGELPTLIQEFGASRLVLDSVSLLEMMYNDRATRRNEIFDFAKSLKRAGVTTMLTSEASEDNPYVSRYGIIEYLTDAVFILRYIRSTDDFRETRLAVEIQKIRDANHSREIKPYEITDEGISVYGQANIF
jgi:KaiC domain protein